MAVKITEPSVADKIVRTITRTGSTDEIQVMSAATHTRVYIVPTNPGDVDFAATGSVQTLTVPTGANFATISVEGTTTTDFIRFRHTSTPTLSGLLGIKLYDGEAIESLSPSTFRFILGTGSGGCTLRIEFYDYR